MLCLFHPFRKLIPKQLLVSLVTALRYEGEEVNMELASDEAKILHEKISDKAYSDEEFIRILSIRSKTQLNATFNQYNDKFGNAINKVEFKTSLKKLVVKFSYLSLVSVFFVEGSLGATVKLSLCDLQVTSSSRRIIASR